MRTDIATLVERQRTDAAETSLYIAAMTAELGKMAAESGLHTLAYILDMARIEAEMRSAPSKAAGPGPRAGN